MTTTPPSPHAADLLAGPRGRRVLLEVLLAAEETPKEAPEETLREHTGSAGITLWSAVSDASFHLSPASGTFGMFWSDTPPDEYPDATRPARQPTRDELFPAVPPDVVARLITEAPLPEITGERLRRALAGSVDAAMYWQEPDGTDALCATGPVRRALATAAEHIAASPLTDWWWSGTDRDDQWSAQWRGPVNDPADVPVPAPDALRQRLLDWKVTEIEETRRAAQERPDDPTANWSGNWWSTPPGWIRVPETTRTWPTTGQPVSTWGTEDAPGDEPVAVHRIPVADDPRILEITGADDWAALCREFPLEVTASRRHDWYRVTGRDGRWFIPDWSAVAERWDAVHLTVAGYLNAATRSIPVPGGSEATDGQDAASVIAGWGPDVTYWLR
ncbi:hypothetical protein [Corynebacterium variabile]|uniref:hypothetical protein n=1 Tax=Corynebacterium variabile TaxID=1727 RepID=UPI0028984418|nr:hypothetical protein [Corynebacterium variabile]